MSSGIYMMDSYIIRVYRRNESKSGEEVAGLVEEVGTDQRQSFHTFSELETTVRQVVGKSSLEKSAVYELHPDKRAASNNK